MKGQGLEDDEAIRSLVKLMDRPMKSIKGITAIGDECTNMLQSVTNTFQ